jgi:hypothetical protein
MTSDRPTLARAFLVGSFLHFLAGVVGPAAVAAGAAALQKRGVTDSLVWMMPALIAMVLGVLFIFHELVVLVALAYLRRQARTTPPQSDLAVDLVITVIGADALALVLGAVTLASLGVSKFGDLVWVLGLFAPALYGTYLLARWIRTALAPAPDPAPEAAGPSADAPRITARDPSLVGLQLYVTAAVAILAFAGLGCRQDLPRTFGIAFGSIVLGRIVVMTVVQSQKQRRE